MHRDHVSEIEAMPQVTAQASSWWALLNSGNATPADHLAFGEWVTRSPERIEAFLQTARLVGGLRSKHLKWPNTPVSILIREAKAAAPEVIELPAQRSDRNDGRNAATEPARSYRLASWRIASMAVVIAAGIAVGGYQSVRPERFETALGEQRSVVLEDGSVVTLNTSSSIDVRLTDGHRLVRLLAGEALFQVAHDAARPFDVSAGGATVRAVGTKFNVDRREASTIVTVVEGKVAVTSADRAPAGPTAGLALSAGEQLTLTPRASPRPVRADLATVTAWTQRKLVFERRPLGEVAAEFNRYNRQTIEIDSAELRAQQVTGVFQAEDPESFMAFLANIPDVTIERREDGTRWVVTHVAEATGQ